MRGPLLALFLAQAPAPGALEGLAEAIAGQVRAAGATAPVALSLSAPGHPALRQAFATLLLARLSGLGLRPQKVSPGADAEAQARARGARALVRLRLTLDGGLDAAGDVLPTWDNFFSGRASPSGRPAAVLFAEVPPDAAVRALARAADAPALLLEAAPLAEWPVRTAALAAGDLDGDGQPELAVLTEVAVEVRGRDGRLLARRSLDSLPPATPPSREPFGTLCICQGLLYAYSAARAVGEVLALEGAALVPRAPLAQPVVACGPPLLEASLLPGVARLQPAGPGWPALPEAPAAWGIVVRPGPGGPSLLVLREDGTALAGAATGGWQLLTGVGAGAALADLSGDGVLRVAASSAQPLPERDSVRLLAGATGREEGSVEVPGRILQVVSTELDADRSEALVLGVWVPSGGATLRVVRAAR